MWDVVLVVGGTALAVTIAVLVIDRVVPVSRRLPYNELSGHFFAAVGAFYAVLLAFVVVAVWEDMNAAKDNTYVEANALPGLYFSSTQFEPAQRAEFQGAAVTYARAVIADEWPRLAHGEPSPQVEDAAKRMRKALLQLDPQTPKQEALYGAMIERVNVINSARRDRLNEARPSIPGYLWFGLIIGGVLVIGIALFFGAPKPLPHALMVITLAMLVAGSLYYAHLMDHPFAGTTTVTPDAFRVALKQMGQPVE
ncbi:hypothetical protein Lesp02_75950 [Lentzea sp. NBRC 105346]|uniref:bestrophin-like domain n=1 Tax=Lentzea sp. NBRC 105346 TaxID=3032205 RepID=UPI0024A4C468|nr:DUF4239 domain-containing protein [Lentzea sp. NBRC 105346]GLZ35408.1 hypothetical protein Lesp02_75950 [Lentzea sp. NBRC 105346]